MCSLDAPSSRLSFVGCRRIGSGALVVVLTVMLAAMSGCANTPQHVAPRGEVFPSVTGTALDGTRRALPSDLAGKPAVLLIGYEMESQFDLDRWILGLTQAQTPAQILELPTIAGMLPGLFAEQIDGGMRRGIPEEDWGGVLTLYGDDAAAVKRFTGGSEGRNGRIVLLDAQGRLVWMHDRGYSAGKLLELDAAVRALR